MSNSLLHRISDWTIPPAVQKVLYSKICQLKFRRDIPHDLSAKFLENRKYKDLHKGERCFILATGPSINRQNLLPLRNEICISVSNFFLHEDAEAVNPKYHVFAPNHEPFNWDKLEKEFMILTRYSLSDTTFFIGYAPYKYSQKNFLDQYPKYRPEKYQFIDYSVLSEINENNYGDPKIWDISKNPFSIRTVVYSAIQIAAYMGFNEIYLLGVDHDYLYDSSSVEGPSHFYSKSDSPMDDTILYAKEKMFLEYHNRWKEYRLIRDCLRERRIFVYNATDGGMLDVFPRITLKEALSQ